MIAYLWAISWLHSYKVSNTMASEEVWSQEPLKEFMQNQYSEEDSARYKAVKHHFAIENLVKLYESNHSLLISPWNLRAFTKQSTLPWCLREAWSEYLVSPSDPHRFSVMYCDHWESREIPNKRMQLSAILYLRSVYSSSARASSSHFTQYSGH